MKIKHQFDFSLKNKYVLVTGATGYLGRRISYGIAYYGGIPILLGRSELKLKTLQEDLAKSNFNSLIICANLTEEVSINKVIEAIQKHTLALDGIVNCAYSGSASNIEDANRNDFNLAYRLNIEVPFFLIQQNLPLLKASAKKWDEGASIVNISSMYGMVSPNPDIYGDSKQNNPPYYGATKSGLIQLTRYLACHLGKENIRVNSISPGPFPAEFIRDTQPEFIKKLCEKNPLARCGEPEELIGPVVFLLSAASSFINGANIPVDGGWTAW